jgi:hypothetical protein
MNLIEDMSFGLMNEYREGKKGKLQRTFISGTSYPHPSDLILTLLHLIRSLLFLILFLLLLFLIPQYLLIFTLLFILADRLLILSTMLLTLTCLL